MTFAELEHTTSLDFVKNHLDEHAYAVRHQLYSANIQQIVIYFEFLIVMNFTLK